jgi:hypothetical protein
MPIREDQLGGARVITDFAGDITAVISGRGG